MITITDYYLLSDKISRALTFASLSDIHADKDGEAFKNWNKVNEVLKHSDYDYMLMPGDLVNDSNYLMDDEFRETFVGQMKGLTNGKYCFVSEGNHDVMTLEQSKWVEGRHKLLLETLKEVPNIVVLDSLEGVNLNDIDGKSNIHIKGLSLPYEFYNGLREKDMYFLEYFSRFLKKDDAHFSENSYNILLLHAIKNYLRLTKKSSLGLLGNTNLVLGGHYHNGLLPSDMAYKVPGRFGFLSPQMEMFPNNVRGMATVNETNFISMGPVNYRVETPLINEKFGTNVSFIHIVPSKTFDKCQYYRVRRK
ncbi:MAG: metallophosphoesterase [Bacilli bacterium]|nr:metallophosphoesterase [Bacilli bacterium]